jgi:hypothetical protein
MRSERPPGVYAAPLVAADFPPVLTGVRVVLAGRPTPLPTGVEGADDPPFTTRVGRVE